MFFLLFFFFHIFLPFSLPSFLPSFLSPFLSHFLHSFLLVFLPSFHLSFLLAFLFFLPFSLLPLHPSSFPSFLLSLSCLPSFIPPNITFLPPSLLSFYLFLSTSFLSFLSPFLSHFLPSYFSSFPPSTYPSFQLSFLSPSYPYSLPPSLLSFYPIYLQSLSYLALFNTFVFFFLLCLFVSLFLSWPVQIYLSFFSQSILNILSLSLSFSLLSLSFHTHTHITSFVFSVHSNTFCLYLSLSSVLQFFLFFLSFFLGTFNTIYLSIYLSIVTSVYIKYHKRSPFLSLSSFMILSSPPFSYIIIQLCISLQSHTPKYAIANISIRKNYYKSSFFLSIFLIVSSSLSHSLYLSLFLCRCHPLSVYCLQLLLPISISFFSTDFCLFLCISPSLPLCKVPSLLSLSLSLLVNLYFHYLFSLSCFSFVSLSPSNSVPILFLPSLLH
ncbi:unnamed protein product [Acanthosepion pharaonis]|uniref:Uncharacterized protein n=1 Tax=Acanthosepion pharaonis TaxID=158019 RepID=A0A812EB66_ACAPH|nr:unnamed protein product [Sepia pharaonis]